MNRTQAHWALIKTASVLCAVFSVLISVSILNTRPDDSSSVPEMVEEIAKRVPAAIPGLATETAKPKLANFQVWKAPCLNSENRQAALTTDSGWIRVQAEACDAEQTITESILKNTSNGYVATFFDRAPTQLTSDFIPLENGTNKLQLEVKLKSGESYDYEWTIQRTTASN